ncbi:unnamed protein product, partial [Wuchereria bancrofti]
MKEGKVCHRFDLRLYRPQDEYVAVTYTAVWYQMTRKESSLVPSCHNGIEPMRTNIVYSSNFTLGKMGDTSCYMGPPGAPTGGGGGAGGAGGGYGGGGGGYGGGGG